MKFIKNLIINALTAVGILIFLWLVISWADVLMHNDPITGDKQYMPGNAIVLLVDLVN